MLDRSAQYCRLLLLAMALPAGEAAAQTLLEAERKNVASLPGPAAAKNYYHLFSRTPATLLRDLSTDRPDKTESPFTVDAGHFQWEMDFAVLTREERDGVRSRTWNLAPVNLKVGLTNDADLQLIYDGYIHQRSKRGGKATTREGGGDLTTRLKINLWGNDGGATTFAVMPFVKAPTSSAGLGNETVEGGVIFPLAVALPGGWGLGAQTEVDLRRDETGSGNHAELINSITFSHQLVGPVSGYVEFFSNVSTERASAWVGTVDLGLTCLLTPNLQLDAGCNIGITSSADDLQPFTGFTLRF